MEASCGYSPCAAIRAAGIRAAIRHSVADLFRIDPAVSESFSA